MLGGCGLKGGSTWVGAQIECRWIFRYDELGGGQGWTGGLGLSRGRGRGLAWN